MRSMRLVIVLILSVGLFVSVGQAADIIYYDFESGNIDISDATTGNSLTDMSGNGNDAKFTTAAYVDSVTGLSVFDTGYGIGQALHVDGLDGFPDAGQRCVIPAYTPGALANGTMQFFIRPSLTQTAPNGVQALWYGGSGAADRSRLDRGYGSWGDPKNYMLRIAGNTSEKVDNSNVTTSTTAFSDGKWHHVAVTFGSAGLKLYLDQTLVDSDLTYTGSLYTGTADWFMAFFGNDSVFDIDNMRLSDVALGAGDLDVIPEPATLGVVLIGGLGLLIRRKR